MELHPYWQASVSRDYPWTYSHTREPYKCPLPFLSVVSNVRCWREKVFFVRIEVINFTTSSVGGSWTVLVFSNSLQASAPSSWGILVYRERTSNVTNRLPGGTLTTDLHFNRNSVVSLIYDGVFATSGLRIKSTDWDIFSVGAPHDETIGLLGIPSLRIMGRM